MAHKLTGYYNAHFMSTPQYGTSAYDLHFYLSSHTTAPPHQADYGCSCTFLAFATFSIGAISGDGLRMGPLAALSAEGYEKISLHCCKSKHRSAMA
jgi:hypothetical protein